MIKRRIDTPSKRMRKADQRRQDLIVLATTDSIMDQSRVIDAIEALRKMDDGSYGTCVDCGHRIAAARLDIRPESIRCVECQQLHDQYLAA